jgi:hypothetical protein
VADHRWSGWPGAWCLDCGIEDPIERCASSGHPLFCGLPDCKQTECKETNSHRYDPYYKANLKITTTGFPECYECHHEYEPLTGDGDGLCHKCYYGIEE